MRRSAPVSPIVGFLLPLLFALAGCDSPDNMFGDPTVGMGGFIADTHTFRTNPNAPDGDAENLQRARGLEPETQPLLPEAGNIWPGPLPAEPTLADLQREQTSGAPYSPPPASPEAPARPRGSSTPPPTAAPPMSQARPSPAAPPAAAQITASPNVVQTPDGPAVINTGGNGVQTFTLPNGSSGRAIPNGNGTMTLIGGDGRVTTVPMPR
jgi:hypothetical protein